MPAGPPGGQGHVDPSTPSSSTDSPHPTPPARIPQDPGRRRRAPGRGPTSATAGPCPATGVGPWTSLDCQEPLTDATPTAREAALLACEGDDPANNGAKPRAPEGDRKTS
ncbi:hypothetical protein CLM85_29240 [Streptomyces albidoflavus]|nr:hypothetical protein CLM81_18585 [Streptomyces albidoflavus]PAX85578.1 hypothetical protein CLM82_31175 [Streptomyces albidoflavus]PBO16473.1 hypothetical protein CLM83_23645 [Streptomyces albidoflavus]PBO21239.1 hypothetical protein CLM85_29240 [Streptomyces albidoflavus]PBO27433.1 hypothetical protein CLM84_25695 [Streptomyces albidoflavus]